MTISCSDWKWDGDGTSRSRSMRTGTSREPEGLFSIAFASVRLDTSVADCVWEKSTPQPNSAASSPTTISQGPPAHPFDTHPARHVLSISSRFLARPIQGYRLSCHAHTQWRSDE